jgi:putative MATE family efflux protein
MNPAIRPMLEGPIVATLFRMAGPNLLVLVVQTLVGVAETYYAGHLGTDTLAGVALVFPVLSLMQTMSNGGIGGGVSSAIARALGAGRQADAEALVYHALVLAILLGTVFMVAAIVFGPHLYTALGGQGAMMAAALTYSNLVFVASIPLWLSALMGAVLRGSGNVRFPAKVNLLGSIITIGLSPALIFWMHMGVAGAGAAIIVYYLGTSTRLLWYVRKRNVLRLHVVPLEWRLFKQIMSVGALSVLSNIQSNLTLLLVTGAVGRLGTEAIAGYGAAVRLDSLLIPILFGLGTAAVPMVAANTGAGKLDRAYRITWIAAAVGAAVTEVIGLAAAAFPAQWIGLFSREPAVLATGTHYLHIVAPFYGFFGLAMMLYFSSQGANRVFWPVMGGTARLLVAGGGVWAAVTYFNADLSTAFVIVACAMVLFALVAAAAMARMPKAAEARPAIA